MYLTSSAGFAVAAGWIPPPLLEQEFERVRTLLFQLAGISLSNTKRALVTSRLEGRLRNLGLRSYGAYLDCVTVSDEERQLMVDLLTTNETRFFREPRHFEFLGERIVPTLGNGARIWSAACSTGEEVYSLAMTLADRHPGDWQVVGTDISRRVLDVARKGIYPLASAQEIPQRLLARHCLKGVRSQEGTFAIDSGLKAKTELHHMNLNGPWPAMDPFDVIFVRNVMIYFDMSTRRQLIERFRRALRRGGYLIVGHAESMMVSHQGFACLRPSIYQLR